MSRTTTMLIAFPILASRNRPATCKSTHIFLCHNVICYVLCQSYYTGIWIWKLFHSMANAFTSTCAHKENWEALLPSVLSQNLFIFFLASFHLILLCINQFNKMTQFHSGGSLHSSLSIPFVCLSRITERLLAWFSWNSEEKAVKDPNYVLDT